MTEGFEIRASLQRGEPGAGYCSVGLAELSATTSLRLDVVAAVDTQVEGRVCGRRQTDSQTETGQVQVA